MGETCVWHAKFGWGHADRTDELAWRSQPCAPALWGWHHQSPSWLLLLLTGHPQPEAPAGGSSGLAGPSEWRCVWWCASKHGGLLPYLVASVWGSSTLQSLTVAQ